MRYGELGGSTQVPPDLTLYLEQNPRLPSGIRVDPFLTTDPNIGIFWIVIVNETNHSITLSSTTSLSHITFQKKQHVKRVSEAKSVSVENFNLFNAVVPGIWVKLQDALRDLLINHQHLFAFETSDLGHTDLVKHTIDTQGQGAIRQRACRFSPHQ